MTPKSFFKVDDEVVGWVKKNKNFLFVNIYKAGLRL